MGRARRLTHPPSAALAHAARDVIQSLNHPSVCGDSVVFLIGSYACKLYCEHVEPYSPKFRAPNDVDLVVCSSEVQEEVKSRLAAYNARVHLVPSKTPGMTYRIVRYGHDNGNNVSKLVKVDVLVAEENLKIPAIPRERVFYVGEWPVAPLSFLLLLRLQGWSNHRHAELAHHREKTIVDVVDLCMHLIPFCLSTKFRDGVTLWEEARQYLPEDFLSLSHSRVEEFVAEHEWTREDWIDLGFALPPPCRRGPKATPLVLKKRL